MGLTLVVTVLALLTVLAGSVVYAAGPAGNRMPFLGGNVELHVASPLEVTQVWSGPTFPFDGAPTTVYQGQKIAEGVIRIKNVSPLAYGAYFRAEPQKVLGEQGPSFDIKTWIRDTLFQSPKDIPPGTVVEMKVEIFISYGGLSSSFQGLDLIVEAGPPPSQTIAACPASGCG